MLKSTKNVFAFVILAAPALSACEAKPIASNSEIDAVKTICEAAKLPIDDNGVKATLRAEFILDRYHGSLLQDESCPNIIVSLYDGPDTVKDEGYQAFARILDANPLQVGLVKAHVKVYGTLRKDVPNRYRLDVIRYIESSEQKAR